MTPVTPDQLREHGQTIWRILRQTANELSALQKDLKLAKTAEDRYEEIIIGLASQERAVVQSEMGTTRARMVAMRCRLDAVDAIVRDFRNGVVTLERLGEALIAWQDETQEKAKESARTARRRVNQ